MAHPYLTSLLLKARVGGEIEYVQLTDDDGDQAADPSVEVFLLGQVDEIVDPYMRRGGYIVPLASTDVVSIMSLLLDIANYKARTRGNRQASDDDRKLYDDALRTLEMYANGDLTLPSFGDAAPSTSSMVIDSPQGGPFFNRITLRDF